MNKLLSVVMCAWLCAVAAGAGPVTGNAVAMSFSIDQASYDVCIKEANAQCEAVIEGRLFQGKPSPIKLFGRDVVVAKTRKVSGGSLVSSDGGICFLPTEGKDEFKLVLTLLVPLQEDSKSGVMSFPVPASVKNSLKIRVPAEVKLVQQPGMADEEGVYHFAAVNNLELRFTKKSSVAAATLVDIDMISHVRLQGKRATITSFITPVQPWPASFTISSQSNAQYVSSSLKASWLKDRGKGVFEVNIPSDAKGPFYLQFAIDESADSGHFEVGLPRISGNNGREGDFVIEDPDDGEIELACAGLVRGIPSAKLNHSLAASVSGSREFDHIPAAGVLNVKVKRFKSVSTPSIVLDSQSFYASFEENGNLLSILELDVPAEVGARMTVKAVQDTEVWSLTVNGRKRKVYANEKSEWVIPLQDGEVSHIQLALLKKGAKLGLHGRLEVVMPETGMASRTVKVGVALPERVDLLSLEGPLSPAKSSGMKPPAEFVGRPYFFSRSFYEGQGLQFALSYKEPVKMVQEGGVK